MAEVTLVEAVNLALARAMDDDPNVVVLGEDVGVNGGVFRATAGLQQRFGADRVIDTPLAELLISGLCVGMATQGLKPVGEIQFMGFIYPCIDQLVNHASRMRNRTQGRLSCPMVLRTPYGAGIRAPEHHSESTEAMLAHIPGLRVVMPSSPERAYGLLLAAIRDPDPVVFLEPTRIYRAAKGEVEDDGEALPLDVAFVLREGRDVTLISWGAMVKETSAAAEELAADGIDAEVIDLATLKPYDEDTVLVFGREDRTLRDRARGCADRRVRRRDRGSDRRTWSVLAARAGRARHRLRYDHAAAAPRAGVHAFGRPHRRRRAQRVPILAERGSRMRQFNLPDLGEGLEEAEIVTWYVNEGDHVVTDQPLVSVETDKAVVEVPSPSERPYRAAVRRQGRSGEGGVATRRVCGRSAGGHRHSRRRARPRRKGHPRARDRARSPHALAALQVLPAVRALARKLDVDLNLVQATGPGGTITRADVERAAKSMADAGPAEPLRGMRRAMAQRMTAAHAEVARTTVTDEADIEDWQKGDDITIRLVHAIAAACQSRAFAQCLVQCASRGAAPDRPHRHRDCGRSRRRADRAGLAQCRRARCQGFACGA